MRTSAFLVGVLALSTLVVGCGSSSATQPSSSLKASGTGATYSGPFTSTAPVGCGTSNGTVNSVPTHFFNVSAPVKIASKEHFLQLSGQGVKAGANTFTANAGQASDTATVQIGVPNGGSPALSSPTGTFTVAADHKSGSFSFTYVIASPSGAQVPGSVKGTFTCS